MSFITNQTTKMKQLFCLFLVALCLQSRAQKAVIDSDTDAEQIKVFFDNSTTRASTYEWLRYICKKIGPRISGSSNYMAAVEYTRQVLDTLGLDSVWLQPVMVPHWERGAYQKAAIVGSKFVGNLPLSCAALGGSAPTPPHHGITGEVIEVGSLDELDKIGTMVKGKIVFFNKPFDPTIYNNFHAYSAAGDQRWAGPNKAAKLGAIACLTRSLTNKKDDSPNAGGTKFDEGVNAIPSAALGVKSAETLSALLKNEKDIKVNIQLDCRSYSDKLAYNVIGEIKGSKFPNEVIVVGGHLDSWDIGEGAHDDGAGCVHSMAALQILKLSGYKPLRTIRCVLFANEENGLKGGEAYAAFAKAKTNERPIAAIESDGGGDLPLGFNYDGNTSLIESNKPILNNWRGLLMPFGGFYMESGGSGADIGKLKPLGTLLFGLRPDSQRYFDYHHSSNDVFETIHKRSLELGAGHLTSLIYLLDKYGVKK